MLKKIITFIFLMIPTVLIIIVLVSKRLTYGLDIDSINNLTEYVIEFSGAKGIQHLINTEAGMIYLMHQIYQYSFWIITFSIIWISIVLFISISTRRKNVNEK